MKRRLHLLLCLVMIFSLSFGLQAEAAKKKSTKKKTTKAKTEAQVQLPDVNISVCLIQGNQVVVGAGGNVVQSDDGNYYLFALQPYEAGIGLRTDYCAVAVKDVGAIFATPLDLNTAASKLYCRFQVAVLRGGVFVPVSNEYYITNPEAVAKNTTSIPMGPKKGLTLDWQYASDLKATGSGYASYEVDISRFFVGGGHNYNYNGKSYQFNKTVVAEYDAIAGMCKANNVHLVMVIKNSWNPATADLIYPTGRVPGKNCYAMNTAEQIGAEKVQAIMHFLAERYSNQGRGTIHSFIIGNEVNNNHPWHFMGDYNVTDFSTLYAKEVRMCYNAIKSANGNARVYINLDQRWMHEDGTPNQYGGKKVLDAFNQAMTATGNIDWGVSFHPHPLPLSNAMFWNIPTAYAGLKLVNNTENTKMIIPSNISVLNNYMLRPELLSPSGTPRHVIVSEMGFTSANATYPTDQNIQAAAMQYGYKLAAQQPVIEAVIIHRHIDHMSEMVGDGMAVGIRDVNGAPKVAYEVYKYMDQPNSAYSNFGLPYIGATSWADLGVQ